MRLRFLCLLLFVARLSAAQTEAPQQSLNHYINFLDKTTEQFIRRFEMLSKYEAAVTQHRKKPVVLPNLPSSGPLEEYYFKTAKAGKGLKAIEREELNIETEAIWQHLNDLDLTCKKLETYVHLKTYETDRFKQSDEHIAKIQEYFEQYSKQKDAFYKQIHQIYRRQPSYSSSDSYLITEKAIEQIILNQRQLLDSLPYFLNAETRAEWPIEAVRRSMLDDEKSLETIASTHSKLKYPASDALLSFKSALASMQDVKRRIIDSYTFTARQSAAHGNDAYVSLMNQFNQDLLAFYKSFVDYSVTARRLLYYPAFSPVFLKSATVSGVKKLSLTPNFQDKPAPTFNVKKSTSPASAALNKTLNDYVEFVNESLRQMHLLQLTLRSYQSSAEYYRDPAKAQSRSGLTYSHEKFQLPSSAYALLLNASASVPESYRASINSQTEVLMNILKEMDRLSIELIAYTSEKQYLKDQLKRSDDILDRYMTLFETFDQKKELLHTDLRRIHESFPSANPASSWIIAGNVLQKAMDDDRDVLFGIKSFLKSGQTQLPNTANIESNARQLIADEYTNLKGLQRYGRSNGLCPYSPYEDLAANTTRFAAMTQQVKTNFNGSGRHPFESFYYFYNNELVYQYNKFVELAKGGLLKAVNQPDLFILRKISPVKNLQQTAPEPEIKESIQDPEPGNIAATKPIKSVDKTENQAQPTTTQFEQKTDTVYVERVRVDTVFVDRGNVNQPVTRSLDGFATNNMVLLLDVSSSMNSPFKMPLLKRSIKSMLTLLRPEDQISIVLYSGKARVVLKPTSGSKSSEIARMIDLLQSDGDTDGNEGIRLAYKTANKQYIRGGNNRIVLATDGEFPVSDEVMTMIEQNARQDLYLTVFTFGRHAHTGLKLKKLSELGKGTYAHVTEESADLQLILEAQGKKTAAR
ncbi:VWA domain-containing protein [Dyadobacter sp. CY326]|uniref:vWA domain-containing protein n=1 Tax=Dyadobacter sp. CY326 TaxID=2907300 RepID=UPI001F217893|nr:VWA domain-containing protein [Dyadobacter sp. CY326]MCE7064527.1 VWA domain-containing protein [Dyadobacter sp. CY326]